MLETGRRRLLLIASTAIFGQLAAITAIFYVVNMDAWEWLIAPSVIYIGFRYLEERMRYRMRT